ncbi:MAG: glycosyl transferase family 1, partial [Pseudomonadota bacterium]
MKLLIVHQNFPGQYKHLAAWLAQNGAEIVALSQRDAPPMAGLRHIRYAPHHKPAKGAYALSNHWEESAGAGFGVALACRTLARDGFRPDVILGHVGWGELTFVKEVWPDVPVIGYFEYFYRATGGSVG